MFRGRGKPLLIQRLLTIGFVSRATRPADARYNRDDDSPPFRLPSNHRARLTNRVIDNFSLLGGSTCSLRKLPRTRFRGYARQTTANSDRRISVRVCIKIEARVA